MRPVALSTGILLSLISIYPLACSTDDPDPGGTGGKGTGGSGKGGASSAGKGGVGTGTGGSTGGSNTGGGTVGGGSSTGGASTGGKGGGSSTGGASTGGKGGGSSTGGTGAGGAPACGNPKLPDGDRCKTPGVTTAAGGELLIDDLEPAAGDTADCHMIRAADGRKGTWSHTEDPDSPGATVKITYEAPGSGSAPGSTRAVRLKGSGFNGWGSNLAVNLAPCYDASKYEGISFWLKADSALAPRIKVSVETPVAAEAKSGGSCVSNTGTNGECYDHFTVALFHPPPVWTRYVITWKQLGQMGWGQQAAKTYKPESQIIGINFAPDWDDYKAKNKGFDIWVDDISFDIKGPFGDTGLKSILTSAMFDQWFPPGGRHQIFAKAYDDLVAVLEEPGFSRIAREGSMDDRKREVAAMLAHVVQETGSLQHVEELSPTSKYCQEDLTYPCASGQSYHGRGPIQISWNYNYGPAGDYLGLGLLANPALAQSNASTTWKTGMFMWMAWKDTKNVLKVGPHFRFLKEGFGATIRAINGNLECGAGNAAAEKRRENFKNFCAALGVSGCTDKIACPPS